MQYAGCLRRLELGQCLFGNLHMFAGLISRVFKTAVLFQQSFQLFEIVNRKQRVANDRGHALPVAVAGGLKGGNDWQGEFAFAQISTGLFSQRLRV